MAVLFIEHKTRDRTVMEEGEEVTIREPYTERGLISLATIQSALGNSFRITGLDSPTEAAELALLLRSGSLADRKSTRLNSSHVASSYAVFCLKKKLMTECRC